MWRLSTAIGAWNASGLDGGEGEFAPIVGGNAAETGKSASMRIFLRIVWLWVIAVSIGLPNFQASVGNGLAFAIEEASANGDTLAA